MAQHDYIIANQSGAAFRSDLNNGLAAIVSQNSGAAQPSTTYAYQWWADTTTGLLKIRNAANNAWITIGTLADANLGLLPAAGGTLTGQLVVLVQGSTSAIEIGTGTTTSQTAHLDFVGDTTYNDYGLRLIRDNAGANSESQIRHKGSGAFSIITEEAGPVAILTNNVERVEFGTTEVVFNDGGADVDFRVEGDTKANLFKVDAGADTVIIDGLTHPSADGTDRQVIATNGSGVLSFASRASIVRGTAVASTSGASIAFTSIPTWVRKLTIVLSGVSTNGTANILLRLSTGGVFASSGYVSNMQVVQGGVASSGVNSTAGFIISQGTASVITTGAYQFVNNDGNGWLGTGVFAYENAVVGGYAAGRVTLGGVLDGIQIVTANGTDTFDEGSVNIIYEG
jgi:hypothetical protein